MSQQNKENPRVREASVNVIAKLRALRSQVDAAIEEVKATVWLPREYPAVFQYYDSRRTEDGLYHVPSPRSDGLILPGETARFQFGVDFKLPGSIPHLPESDQIGFGFERIFDIDRLIIEDEDAPHFGVAEFTVGHRILCGSAINAANGHAAIPGSRFAATAEPIVSFGYYGDIGVHARIAVINASSEPRAFRAKLVGDEQPAV